MVQVCTDQVQRKINFDSFTYVLYVDYVATSKNLTTDFDSGLKPLKCVKYLSGRRHSQESYRDCEVPSELPTVNRVEFRNQRPPVGCST